MRIAYVIPAYPPLASQPFVVNEMIAVQDGGPRAWSCCRSIAAPGGRRAARDVRAPPAGRRPAGPRSCDARDRRRSPLVGAPAPSVARRCARSRGLHRAAGAQHLVASRGCSRSHRRRSPRPGGSRRLGVERLHAHFANQTADCAAIAGGVAGLPFSFTAHAYDIYSTAPRQRNATLDWKLRHAARVFTVSDYARDLLRARLTAVERERVCTAYVGIPTALFRAGAAAVRTATASACSCVARFQEKKGLDTLVDACAPAARPGRPVPPRG